jgi:c-di-GMP-binding flagellar brake protein YcgR
MLSFFGFKRKPKKAARKRVLLPEQQRAAVRLDVTVPGLWRDAPGGKAVGAYTRGSITDISRTGASLTVDREIKRGGQIEIKVSVSTSAQPLVLLGEVMRSSKIEASGKSALGLRFLGITPEEDRKIMEFINKRQAERRSRGLA